VAAPSAQAPRVTTPKEAFGFNFGDDYQLATYQQLADYWRKLDAESDRMVLQEIGRTSENRPHLMAIVTSPQNHKNLQRYREISRRLALAEGLSDDAARALAREGKAVVWIDGGLHASEVLGAQQLGEMVYQMVSRTDEETLRFLNDTIILFVHANPDGHDLVAGWYMRNPVPEKRSGAGLPRLYHHYIGHDNNRDFFASTQKETENINRVLYHEWSPQVLYNHHQSGPAGTVFWSPPFRDPFNYNYDPMLVLGLQQLGLAIHARMAAEGKPGAASRAAGAYDGWWNGGIRNTAAFHNVLAILTEMIGNPTPMRIPFVLSRQVPTSDLTFPIAPQTWHFRQSIEYSLTANRAVLDFASRWRETVLFNVYQMGRNSIARGSTDTWTVKPHRYAAVAASLGVPAAGGGGGGGAANPERDAKVMAAIRDPQFRDPRGYIIPASQADFPTAVKFINALREVGIGIQRATREFAVNGKTYPAGSFVVMTNQAFRPHVIDMFEPQDHPDNIPFPGAPPTPPYDHAGWTLAFQMGVEFDRVLDPFTGPFEPVTEWNVKPPAGAVTTVAGATGYLLDHRQVDSFVALNRLLKAGEEAYWLRQPLTANGRTYDAGTWFVTAKASTRASLDKLVSTLGVSAAAVLTPRPADALRVTAPRVGLWDQYGGSMDSGWARWILEQYEFPFTRVFPPDIDAGNLNAKYDVIVFVDGGIPAGSGGGQAQPAAADIPAEFRPMLGRMSVERSIPELRRFAEAGGTLLTIGASSTNLIRHLQPPIDNHLQEGGQPLPAAKFYTPGSVLTARVDVSHPIAHGMKERTDIFFDDSPVFRLGAGAEKAGIRAIAWFDTPTPLKSGWSWGQQYLQNGAAAIDAPLGKGRALLFGPEIMKRAQPHGTFAFLFNGLYYATVARAGG
jgi:hypothetical protein